MNTAFVEMDALRLELQNRSPSALQRARDSKVHEQWLTSWTEYKTYDYAAQLLFEAQRRALQPTAGPAREGA